ncbi:hypothetical protein LSH36_666g00000 [Paralvinella palmiformis]|uniref:Prefoldin subunit 2 n=1 Tax=Paralvinella palmiformis TaxID=53620 RepID=A0AAD9J3F6_9ANNE|nr:hypothetical protein LSH36_666g00000 [Paralvinella palmiformis]
MATTDSKTQAKPGKNKQMSQEQIVGGFQELRNQQRAIASKISEMEMDIKEHDLVIEALKDVDPERKCFRMIGGVLVERTVKEVLPALINNHQQISKIVESLTKQLESKGTELNEYREKHNIRIRGEEESKESSSQDKSNKSSGVLVAKGSP